MFEIYRWSEGQIIFFGLVMVRVSSMLVTMPIFGTRTVPGPVKALLSLAVALVMLPFVHSKTALPLIWKDDLIVLILREAFVGAFMGFLARMMFMAIDIAGQILSFSTGLSAAQLVNPSFGESSSVMEQFETVLATLLFLAINGHHMFFEALYRSFELAPLGILKLNPAAMKSAVSMAQMIFEVGVKLAGPLIAVILFLNIAMGVVGRAVPQINVFVISFPVNIMVGFFIFMVSIPLLLTVMETDFDRMGLQIIQFVKGF